VVQRISRGDVSIASYADIAGRDPSTLGHDELLRARRIHLARLSGQGPVVFVKTHHPVARLGPHSFIPADLTRGAVHVVRNPLDMAVSYADHFRLTPETTAEALAMRGNAVPHTPKTVAQLLGNWSEHTASWADCRAFPVLTLRYEDMLARPHESFTRVVEAIAAPLDRAALERAVEASSFATLSRLEAETGFSEKGVAQERFFRSGQSGQWREALPKSVVDRIRRDHGTVMQRFGYF
jgi:hypothetical protein